MVRTARIELATSSMSTKRSPTELCPHKSRQFNESPLFSQAFFANLSLLKVPSEGYDPEDEK
jgi:hypothetical protein